MTPPGIYIRRQEYLFVFLTEEMGYTEGVLDGRFVLSVYSSDFGL